MKAGRSRFAESNPGRQWMKAGESRFAESNPGSLMNIISPLTCEWRCKPAPGFFVFYWQ